MKNLLFILSIVVVLISNAYAAPQRSIWVDNNENPLGTAANPVYTSGGGSISGITSSNGNIGINSTNPGAKLDVQGTIRANDLYGVLKHVPNLTFVQSASNPTLTSGGEASMIMQDDGVTVDQWYRLAGGTEVRYRTADNALLDNWSSSVAVTGLISNPLFPTVFKVGSTYYMFVSDNTEDNTYLYSSTDKTSWTNVNGGSTPAFSSSPTATDWDNKLYNVGVAVVGTTIHIMVEGKASSGDLSSFSYGGYASADISNPIFTIPDTPTISNFDASTLIYVPQRNAFVLLYCDTYPNDAASTFRLKIAKASLEDDLTDPDAWKVSNLSFLNLGQKVSDFDLIFTPGKTYPSLLYYNYAQSTGYQAYGPFIHSPADLYDSVPTIGGLNFDNLGIGTSFADNNLTVGIGTETNGNGITISAPKISGVGSQPGLTFDRYSSGTLHSRARIVSGQNSIGSNDGDLAFQTNAGTSPTTKMYIGSGGNVGVNTTVPSARFQVGAQLFNVMNGGNVGIGTINPGQPLDISGNARIRSNSSLFFGDDNTIFMNSTPTGTAGDWRLLVGNSTRLTVRNGGNVGIATSLPADLLEVKMATNQTGVSITGLTNTGAGSQPALVFNRYSSSALNSVAKIYSGSSVIGSNDGDLNFMTGAGTSPTVKMYIGSGGNVGIGSTAPGALLDVQGSVRFSSIPSGKATCKITATGMMGTCTSAVGADGTCTCG